MKSRILNMLFLFALVVMVSACKSNEEVTPSSKTSLLTAKSWAISKFEVSGVDVTSEFLDDCDADNFIKFKSDGTLTEDVGSVKCDVTDTNTGGTWAFKTSETIITVHPDGGDATDWKLIDLTATLLKISTFDSDIKQNVVISFVAK